jgi:hypothetical protein
MTNDLIVGRACNEESITYLRVHRPGNESGDLRNDSNEYYSDVPVQVLGVNGQGVLSGVVAVTSGDRFSGALPNNGTVVS